MLISQNLIDELDALTHYKLESMQVGIKVHKDATPAMISAIQRLHEKGLVTQNDGGYLTNLGMEIAGHAHKVLAALRP